MAIDLQNETRVRMGEGYKLPESPSERSLRRWATEGVRSRSTGHTVRMETAQWCGVIVTTVEAFERFNRRLNGECVGDDDEKWKEEPE